MRAEDIRNEDGTVIDLYFVGYVVYRINMCGIAPTSPQIWDVVCEYRDIPQKLYEKYLANLASTGYIFKDYQWMSEEGKWHVTYYTYKVVIYLYDKLLEVCNDTNLEKLSVREFKELIK